MRRPLPSLWPVFILVLTVACQGQDSPTGGEAPLRPPEPPIQPPPPPRLRPYPRPVEISGPQTRKVCRVASLRFGVPAMN